MQTVSCNTQTAYEWGQGGVGWSLVETDGLLVIEETLAPSCSENRHYHAKAAQCFYVLECTGWMKIDAQNKVLAQCMAEHIHPRTDHAIANESSNEIQFLLISSPSTWSDRNEIVIKK